MLLSRNKMCQRWLHAVSIAALCSALSFVPVAYGGTKAIYSSGFVDEGRDIPRVHAASLVEAKGKLFTAWYAGTREGAQDVSIFLSTFDAEKQKWRSDQKLFDRKSVQKSLGRYIKKLGNPVLGVDARGRFWLYFVSVSAGGWSGSAINYSISSDNAVTWSSPKRLVTSPFFNVSTLVRTQPFNYADGSIGLPVYHELLGKFGELLQLNQQGKVLAKHRISWGASSLQPAIVDLGKNKLLALLRNADPGNPGVLISHSADNGESWSAVRPSELPNTDSSVAGIRDNKQRILLVFNNTNTNRNILSLAVSFNEGKSWKIVHDFENSKEIHDEFFERDS